MNPWTQIGVDEPRSRVEGGEPVLCDYGIYSNKLACNWANRAYIYHSPINIFIRFRFTKRTVVWLKKADFIQSSTRQLIIWLAGVSSWSAEQMSLVCPCSTLLLRSSSSGASVKPAGLARRETRFFFANDLDLISFTACSLDANLEETGTHIS
jgi:hypothetical protein